MEQKKLLELFYGDLKSVKLKMADVQAELNSVTDPGGSFKKSNMDKSVLKAAAM